MVECKPCAKLKVQGLLRNLRFVTVPFVYWGGGVALDDKLYCFAWLPMVRYMQRKFDFIVTKMIAVRYTDEGGEQVTDFQEAYNLYFRNVYRYALSLCRNESLAEEITQETFYKALQRLDSFDGEGKMFVWLCQIAKNTYISMCRKNKHLDFDVETDLLPSGRSIEESFFDRETAIMIHKVIHTLEEPYKEVFSLRTFGELSFKEIAEIFGRTESWARVTYHRARLRIKEELQ